MAGLYVGHQKDPDYSNRECCMCGGKDTYIYGDIPIWKKCKCGKTDCNGWLCNKCYSYMNDRKPGSNKNIIKSMADHRIGNLDRYSSHGKGFIGAQIVAKTLELEDCNIKMENFCFYVDLSKHLNYGYVEVKTGSLNEKNGWWDFGTKRLQDYDTIILVCMDSNKPWRNVERIYAIPWEVAVKCANRITIIKNPSRVTWYEEFRIDEKPFNDTYHRMDINMCDVLRKDDRQNKTER